MTVESTILHHNAIVLVQRLEMRGRLDEQTQISLLRFCLGGPNLDIFTILPERARRLHCMYIACRETHKV